jgi:hypothetical protein
MKHCLSIVWCTQITILMVSKRQQLQLGESGTLHKTSPCLPLQSPSDAGLRFLQIAPSRHRVAGVHPLLGRFGSLPIVRACLHNESRQRKSRTCQQTCSLPIAEVRVAALFRRTLNPVVLQSRNLETSFPRKRQVLLQYLLAHTAPISNGDSRTIRDVGYCIMLVFCVPEARFGVRTQDGRIK